MKDGRVSIYVGPELKLKMQEFNLNWSAIARRAFMDTIDSVTMKMQNLDRNLAVLGLSVMLLVPLAKVHNYSVVNAGTNCTTTCYNLGNQRICNTHCW